MKLASSLILLLLCIGCQSTVTAPKVKSHSASFDVGGQNSGLLYFMDDGSAVITAHARDRYNALLEVYAKRLLPPVDKDDGVVAGPVIGGVETFKMTPQALERFGTLNRWRKQDQ